MRRDEDVIVQAALFQADKSPKIAIKIQRPDSSASDYR